MATKKQNSDQPEKPQNAYFLSLELENVRCFGEKQKIDFSDGEFNPKQWTIILGDNGTGKTTLLQSLIGLTPSNKKSRFGNTNVVFFSVKFLEEDWGFSRKDLDYLLLRFKFLSNINSTGTINSVNYVDSSKKKGQTSGSLFSEGEAKFFFCLAYGASRKAGETSISEQSEEDAYITLFDETVLLTNPEEWLLRSHYESLIESESQEKRTQKLSKIKETLIQILPDISEIKFGEKNTNNKFQPIVEFKTPYGWVEAKDLSLGYRTSMAWMVDFASRMFDLYPDSENPLAEPAVVLIDEIDLHLHPKWQRDLLDWLSNLFPNTQFIVTTHSPLIVQAAAARDANFAVCRREGDHVVIDQSVDAVRGWRADQILSSDLFDVPKRDSELEKWLKEKETILSKPKLTKKDEIRLAELEEKIGFLPISENGKDDEAMKIIREAADWVKTNSK